MPPNAPPESPPYSAHSHAASSRTVSALPEGSLHTSSPTAHPLGGGTTRPQGLGLQALLPQQESGAAVPANVAKPMFRSIHGINPSSSLAHVDSSNRDASSRGKVGAN